MGQARGAKPAGRWARLAPGLAALTRYDRRWLPKDVLAGVSVAACAPRSRPPVEWVIVDASPINWIDATALQRLDELRAELAARGITLGIARAKLSLNRAFSPTWIAERLPAMALPRFPTLKAALHAFERRRVGADADQATQPPPAALAQSARQPRG